MGSDIATPMFVEGFSDSRIELYPDFGGTPKVKPALDKNFEFEAWIEASFQNSGYFTMGFKEDTLPLQASFSLGKNVSWAPTLDNDLYIDASGFVGLKKISVNYTSGALIKIKIVWISWNLNTNLMLVPFFAFANDTNFIYNSDPSVSSAPNQMYVRLSHVKMKYLGQGFGLSAQDITRPNCAIIYPSSQSTINGTVKILVNAVNDVGAVKEVGVSFDKNGLWFPCTFNAGTGYWEYNWDTKKYQNKDYIISARALV